MRKKRAIKRIWYTIEEAAAIMECSVSDIWQAMLERELGACYLFYGTPHWPLNYLYGRWIDRVDLGDLDVDFSTRNFPYPDHPTLMSNPSKANYHRKPSHDFDERTVALHRICYADLAKLLEQFKAEIGIRYIAPPELVYSVGNDNEGNMRAVYFEIATVCPLYVSKNSFLIYGDSLCAPCHRETVGATAFIHGMKLVTDNLRDFKVLPGLRVEKPY